MIFLRSLVSIKTMMTVRLLGGIYCDISTNRLITLVAKLYCAFISTTLVYFFGANLLSLSFRDMIFLVTSFMHYVTSVIVNFLTNGEYFLKFFTALEKIDFLLGTKPQDDIAFSRMLFTGMLMNKIVRTVVFCLVSVEYYNCLSQVFMTTVGFVIDLSVDLSNFTRIIMFETMWCRMVLLRKRFERELSEARRFKSGEMNHDHLRKCLVIYNNLVKSNLQCDVPMKFMVSVFFS